MIHLLDVKLAFMNGEIDEVIHVMQPEGFLVEGTEGFIKSNNEHSLYLKWSSINTLVVGVYVDGLTVTRSSSDVTEALKAKMKLEFDMSNLGSLSSYLGLEVKQEESFIFLSQKAYAQKLLEHAKLAECNVVATPPEARAKFTSGEGNASVIFHGVHKFN